MGSKSNIKTCPYCNQSVGSCGGTSGDGGSCCAEITVLADSINNLIELFTGGGDQPPLLTTNTIKCRETCNAAGEPVLAYDIIPNGVVSADEITTIYRELPADESICICPA